MPEIERPRGSPFAPPTDMPRPYVNPMTLAPLFRLALAERDSETPNPRRAWEVFKPFARLPADADSDLCSFQATWKDEDDYGEPTRPLLHCALTRELTVVDVEGRGLEITWALPADAAIEEVEVWSDAFDDIERFFAHLESLPLFQALLATDVSGALTEIDLRSP